MLVGLVRGEDADGEGSGDALDGAANGFFEGDGGFVAKSEDGFGLVGLGCLPHGRRAFGVAVLAAPVGRCFGSDVQLVFDEVGDDLGVGLGDELVALGDEGALEGEVVFDDAVVDNDEGATSVAVGMSVFFGRPAVGGPAGVADAERAVDGRVGDDGFEVAELAWGAAEFEPAGATGYGDAGGVIAAVLQAAKTFNDDGDDRLRADVTNNSTHVLSLDGQGLFCASGRIRLLGDGTGMGQR